MDYLKNSILATLAYYDSLGMALTSEDVHQFLINPSRIEKIPLGLGDFKVSDVRFALDRLVSSKQVVRQGDMFMLSGRDQLYQLRLDRVKIALKKWKKFLGVARWLAVTPYLRGVFASGSLAMGNTDNDSDFDVLVIAKPGRLYTCRTILWLLTTMMGVRRRPQEVSAPNKLCFNHYITENALYIKHESIFNAQMYVNLKPVLMTEDLFKNFYSANGWLNTYVYNFKPKSEVLKYALKPNLLSRSTAKIGEFFLNNKFGDWLEKKASNLQKEKISRNPITHEAGGRVIFTDSELEFHPRSFEKVVLNRYKSRLTQLGIRPVTDEKDSGLRV